MHTQWFRQIENHDNGFEIQELLKSGKFNVVVFTILRDNW